MNRRQADSVPSTMLTAMSMPVIVIRLFLFGKLYRGAVSGEYIEKEFAKLAA